jgi:hypothetical protein
MMAEKRQGEREVKWYLIAVGLMFLIKFVGYIAG